MALDYDIPDIIYMNSCPNCGSNVSSLRLYKGSVCEKCIKEDITFDNLNELLQYLSSNNNLLILRIY
jgi:reverse gyrase